MKISSIGLTLVTIFIPVFLMLPDSIESEGLVIQLLGICLDIDNLLFGLTSVLLPPPNPTSQIKFYLWSRRGEDYVRYEIKYDDDEAKLKEIFSYYTIDELFVDVYFHDVASNGNASWILDSKDIFFNEEKKSTERYVILSVDYADLSKTRDSSILALDLIGNKTSELLIWMKTVVAPKNLIFDFIGHGMGAIVAAGTAQKTKDSIRPSVFVALDPEILTNSSNLQNCPSSSKKVVQIPQISTELGDKVIVLHLQTCSISPTIEPCKDSSTAHWGHRNFFPNGGTDQPGCNNNKTCNRKKATEYFNEANSKNFQSYYGNLVIKALLCDNYQQFLDQKCRQNIILFDFLVYRTSTINIGRFYLKTNSVPEYLNLQPYS